MSLSSLLIGWVVVGSVIITVIAHRVLGRRAFRKYCGAYLFSAAAAGCLSFFLLLFLGVTFPKLAAAYFDAVEGILHHVLPNTAVSKLVIMGHFVGAICLGMTMGALAVWRLTNDSDAAQR